MKQGKENIRFLKKDHRIPIETPIEGSPETHVKAKSEGNIREAPRRIQRTREASREDAIASTHQFFAVVHKKIEMLLQKSLY